MSVNLRRLAGKLNPTTRAALEAAAALCVSRTNYDIHIEHFLLKLIEIRGSDLEAISARFGIDSGVLERDLSQSLARQRTGNERAPAISRPLVDALAAAWLYGSVDYDGRSIRSGFFVIALLAEETLSQLAFDISPAFRKVDLDRLRQEFAEITGASKEAAESSAIPAPGDARTGPRVFISYRRQASDLYATILYDRIAAAVPGVRVFRDRDSLVPGVVYAEEIRESIRSCDIVLALIDEQWLRAKDEQGRRRLDDPGDWVRIELAAALSSGKTIVPCLIGRAKLPAREALPTDLAGLEERQAIRLSKEIPRTDTEPLIRVIREWRPAGREQPSGAAG